MMTSVGKLILSALCFLVALHVSAQGTELSLVNTMNLVANALTSRGVLSWTETLPDIFGASYKMNSSLTEVNADPSACSLSWKSIYTSSSDKLIETYLVRLESVSSTRVQPYAEYRQSESEQKVEVSPEIFVVEIKTEAPLTRNRELYHGNKLKSETKLPSDREARVVFADEQIAKKVADGISQAAKSCAGKTN